jgi:osmotically-inducible protein OsmY
MSRQRKWRVLILSSVSASLILGPARAEADEAPKPKQAPASPSAADVAKTQQVILQALGANPITAPYAISVPYQNGRYTLTGRVGSKTVHDAAVQTMIALGYPFRDNLIIDTAESVRAAAWTASGYGPMAAAGAVGPLVGSPLGLNSYIYPPPLFGRYDDPFFGLEPPVISYPPWWRGITLRRAFDPRLLPPSTQNAVLAANTNGAVVQYPNAWPQQGQAPIIPNAPAAQGGDAPNGPAAQGGNAPNAPAAPQGAVGTKAPAPEGQIEMTIDPRGVATLRGVVPTLSDRIAIGQQLARTPGITEVINLLSTKESETADQQPAAPVVRSDVPPPPPTPALREHEKTPARQAAPGARRPKAGAKLAVDRDNLGDRVAQALARRPLLADQPIHVAIQEGVAYLTGKVPTVYEAMLAFRAAQQTPGIRDVVEQLEFTVPDGESPNPLLSKGRPEDVEPYLESQIRHQVGDLAHVDRVRVSGNTLEVRGTLDREADRHRLEAILRSMPILRGFHLNADFQTDSP